MPGSARTILLVEDEAIIALAERRGLESRGYSVITVSCGEEAVRTAGVRPDIDLVLIDINLGDGIDGTQAAELILDERDIPVVFLSSHTEREIVEKTERITSYGYVAKDSGIAVLDASIKMAFKLFEANQRLKATTHRLEATLDALPDLQFELGLDGRYYGIHSPQDELLYRPAEELIGRDIHDILPAQAAESVMGALKEACETGRSFGRQYELNLPMGVRWFEISVARIASEADQPHFIFLARDITERRRAEEALREREARYRSLFENAPVGIFYSTVEGKELSVNAEYARLFGYSSPEELLHIVNESTAAQVIFDRPEERARLVDDALKSVGTWIRTEQAYRRKNGTHVLTNLAYRALPENPSVLEGFVEDISERREAEEKIKALLGEKETLLKEVHHRVKNSMHTIMSLLDLQAMSAKQREAASALEDAARRVESMILLYDKLYDAADFRSAPAGEYLSSLVDQVLETLPCAGGIRVEKRIEDFELDLRRLQPLGMIINELLTNAMKYAFAGRDRGSLKISAGRRGGCIGIVVEDDGVGMPDSIDFARGSGFGLTLVGSLTEQIGGSIRIERERGTRIVLEFDQRGGSGDERQRTD